MTRLASKPSLLRRDNLRLAVDGGQFSKTEDDRDHSA